MSGRIPREWANRRDSLIKLASAGHTSAVGLLGMFSSDLDAAFDSGALTGHQWSELKFTCSSLQINLGSDRHLRDAVGAGVSSAREALDRDVFPELVGHLRYNVANGLLALHDLDLKRWRSQNPQHHRSLYALEDRDRVRQVRALFAEVGHSSSESSDTRSRALCNLGNTLDHSGRWLEAYQAYVDALDADPTNGNAAGNAAELLRFRAARGRGLPGHYAAVYERYRQQAVRNRARTVELAGEEVARRWDALPVAGDGGHASHDGDQLDEYQRWIKRHRLALTVAVEGLGSNELRWDSAMIESVTVDINEPDPPPIFTSMNVLKAEYLVARRLAFDGERRLLHAMYSQHPDDTGVYSDTLDMSVYGEPPAQLVLAQRATLDVLDKIAVAANEHFASGVAPRKVTFGSYWREPGADSVRLQLPDTGSMPSAAVALAELAFDIDSSGLYPEAKTLRNAGTHRLVHLTHDSPTGATEHAHSSIDAKALIDATHQSLRVARAAYVYLIDLIQDQQDCYGNDESRPALPLPTQM